jgi:hypothetical protein
VGDDSTDAKETMMHRYGSLILLVVVAPSGGDELANVTQALDAGAGQPPVVPAAPNAPLMRNPTNETQPAAWLSSGLARRDERLNLYYTSWRKSYVHCVTNDGGACSVSAMYLASPEYCLDSGGCLWSNFPEGTYELTATRVVCGVESARSAVTTVVVDRTCNAPTIAYDYENKVVSGTSDPDTAVITVWGRRGTVNGVWGGNILWEPTGDWNVLQTNITPGGQGAWSTMGSSLTVTDGNGLYEIMAHARDRAGNEAWSSTSVKPVPVPSDFGTPGAGVP